MTDSGVIHDRCNYLGARIDGTDAWWCNKCGHGGRCVLVDSAAAKRLTTTHKIEEGPPT